MGEPKKHAYKPKNDSWTRVSNKKAFDASAEKAGIGNHHAGGVSAQRGRTTIVFRNGERIVARENGRILVPEEIRRPNWMKMSVWDAMESRGNIEYVDKSKVGA